MESLRNIWLFSLAVVFITACSNSGDDDPSDDQNPVNVINIPDAGFTSPTTYDGFTLTWQEEFDGTELNTNDWSYDLGTGDNGWGNNELQSYTRDNITMKDGHLVITAKQQFTQDGEYTSSRIKTQGSQNFQYGRIDVRAALPKGQGIWPAVWMLGSNFENVGWPLCGEIDIMEMIGGAGRENTVHGTLHWQGDNGHVYQGGETTLSEGTFNDEFHVFSIIWTATDITWLVDDVEFHSMDTTPTQMNEFRNSFFFIVNLAVGGNWPGAPNTSTTFPQHLIVDYIRVFSEN